MREGGATHVSSFDSEEYACEGAEEGLASGVEIECGCLVVSVSAKDINAYGLLRGGWEIIRWILLMEGGGKKAVSFSGA